MKEQKRIPVSKVKRASKIVSAGAKVGINYLKHFASGSKDTEALNEANAEDIYNTLSQMKGSALKMAQMMSMDQNMMPKQYTQKFMMAQYSVPPLSYPLVQKIFKQDFNKSPNNIFDSFSKDATNAASMGQVHKAEYQGKALAVKVQYPGVAESVESDLNLIKPLATRMIGMQGADVNSYFDEVKDRLLEEADYQLELRRSQELASKSEQLKGVEFPEYFPDLSSNNVITMSWLDGMHLDSFLATSPSQEIRNTIGQNLWDFYTFQINELRMVQADPHPGNFLLKEDGRVGVIDFGCIKELEPGFYELFFSLLNPAVLEDKDLLLNKMFALELLHVTDTEAEKKVLIPIFEHSLKLLAKPFYSDVFDFGDKTYVDEVFSYADEVTKLPEIRKSKKARGPKDALFINRTFFGLYNMLHLLGAQVNCKKGWQHFMD